MDGQTLEAPLQAQDVAGWFDGQHAVLHCQPGAMGSNAHAAARCPALCPEAGDLHLSPSPALTCPYLRRRSIPPDASPTEAVGRQLRIRMVPEMVDLGGETLKVVGEYRLPLKLVLPSGDRAALDVTIAST